MLILLIQVSIASVAPHLADSLTLDQARARARDERPQMTVASAIVERARGAARVLTMIPNPTAQFESDRSAPTRKATVVQQLSWLPRHAADAAAGRYGIERSRADSVQTIANIERDVAAAFFTALAAERQLGLAEEQRSLADSLALVAARRAQAGEISDLERDQIAQEAGRARLASAQAREEKRIASAQFARSVAWEKTMPPIPVGSLDAGLDAARARRGLSGLDALPSIRAAVADSAAAAARLRSAQIARVPIPGVLAAREWGGGADVPRNTILGLSMPLPLWSWGGEAVAVARGEAREQAALAAEARLTVDAELKSAEARVEERSSRALFARDSLLPQAQRLRAGAVRLYEEGQTSVLPVLDALRAERDVTRAAVAELLAFQTARADLAALIGRLP